VFASDDTIIKYFYSVYGWLDGFGIQQWMTYVASPIWCMSGSTRQIDYSRWSCTMCWNKKFHFLLLLKRIFRVVMHIRKLSRTFLRNLLLYTICTLFKYLYLCLQCGRKSWNVGHETFFLKSFRQKKQFPPNFTLNAFCLKGAGTLVDVLQLSYSFHQNWSKLGTAITEDLKNW
jgi:hypothetical protein